MQPSLVYKVITCWLLLLFVVANAHAQTNKPTAAIAVAASSKTAYQPGAYDSSMPRNYIRTWIPQQPYSFDSVVVSGSRTAEQVNRATQYVDGLGRDLQTVSWQSAPGKKDMVAPVVYDEMGRQQYQFMAYTAIGSGGGFATDPFAAQNSFYSSSYPTQQPAYQNEKFFYSKTIFENGTGRPSKTFAPGNSWAGSEGDSMEHAISVAYLTNKTSDSVRIWRMPNTNLAVDTGSIPYTDSIYKPGRLYKIVTADERGNKIIEYKDFGGRVILKKVQAADTAAAYNGWLCTYYVYDDYGLLRFVVSPKATAWLATNNWQLQTAVINELCFRYAYDTRNRMAAKKVPGAAWVQMVYDRQDRLVFSQDGNARLKNWWLYTQYDALDRTLVTGMMTLNITRDSLQAKADSLTDSSSTSTVVVEGATPYIDHLSLDSRDTSKTSYSALHSIVFLPGFVSEDAAQFYADITEDSNSIGRPFSDSITVNSNAANIPGASLNPLVCTVYDTYPDTTKPFTSIYNSRLDKGNNLYAAPLPVANNTDVKGMVTVTKVKIITSPYDFSGSWMENVSFYDSRYRVIQTQAVNYKGGNDTVITRYNFSGVPVCVYSAHSNPAASAISNHIKTNMDYDHAGRLLDITKEVNDDVSTRRSIARSEYDDAGKLWQKKVGQKNAADNSAMEEQQYTYNIRGWLKAINKDYTNGTVNTNTWFGTELSYDWGFEHAEYNGNIAGITWRSRSDGERRAFGFGYDNTNRLLFADFNQHFSDGWGKTQSGFTIDFSVQMGDGLQGHTAYDENGNILAMRQRGLQINSSPLIDSLSYNYFDNSNRLKNVIENIAAATGLGDFNPSAAYKAIEPVKTTATEDYNYDANGNLITDKNKNIVQNASHPIGQPSGIKYNFLNLPGIITFVKDYPGSVPANYKGSIQYIYDALGNKLGKTVTEEGSPDIITTTEYVNGYVYENNVLQFFGHEEGRVRHKGDTGFVYDYFLKDHLGNIRVTLTDEWQVDKYPVASLEQSKIAAEKNYYSIDTANIVDTSIVTGITNYPNDNGIGNNPPDADFSIANSAKLYKLNSNSAKTGLGITLKVMAGDTLDVFGKSYYFQNTTGTGGNSTVPVIDLLNAFLTGPAAIGASHGINGTAINTPTGITGIASMMTEQDNETNATPTKPRAFINVIFFDEQFKSYDYHVSMVGNNSVVKDHFADLQNLNAGKSGYVYIYCSNESPVNVFFDNLQVVHTRGPLVQEQAYSPWGLVLQGISSSAVNFGDAGTQTLNYNGKEAQRQEFSDGSGFECLDFGARMYDNQLGRWDVVDPLAEKYEFYSQYHFTANNPILFKDKDGKQFDIWVNGQRWSYQQQMVNGNLTWGFFNAAGVMTNDAWAIGVSRVLSTLQNILTGEFSERFNDMLNNGNHLIYDPSIGNQGGAAASGGPNGYSSSTVFPGLGTNSVEQNLSEQKDASSPITPVQNGSPSFAAIAGGILLGQTYTRWNGNAKNLREGLIGERPIGAIKVVGNANIIDRGNLGNGTVVHPLNSDYQRAWVQSGIISQQAGSNIVPTMKYFVAAGYTAVGSPPYLHPINGTVVQCVYKLN